MDRMSVQYMWILRLIDSHLSFQILLIEDLAEYTRLVPHFYVPVTVSI